MDDERGYGRYEPDPNDARARRSRYSDDRRDDHFEEPVRPVAAPAPDLTRENDDWSRPAAVPPPVVPPPAPRDEPPPATAPRDEPAHVDHYDDAANADADTGYAYEYDDWEERRERRSGAGAFAILGFLALGVLALLGGAALAGVFGDDPGTGAADPTPSASASAAVTHAPSASASAGASAAASGEPGGSPAASGGPVVFPDGFSAEAQPCLPGSAGGNGCDANGASNNGVVDIWVGFENGTGSDVIGATVLPPDGGTPVDGSIDLADIGCTQSCNGWTYFPFRNLAPGTYQVNITRNGEPAGSTTFEVS